MVMRGIPLYLIISVVGVVGFVCVPVQSFRCNVTAQYINSTDCTLNYTKVCLIDVQVSINSTGSQAKEGDDITLTCVHNLPDCDLVFGWKKDGKEILEGGNKSELALKKVRPHQEGQYTCNVDSPCGSYESLPHGVTVSNGIVVLLVICGVSALVLVVIMGLIMKFKLKRDNAKHRERIKQRAQAGQSGGPAPFTPRES